MADTKAVSIERLQHYDEKIKLYKATDSRIGMVKPDGVTITIDADGTISGSSSASIIGDRGVVVDKPADTHIVMLTDEGFGNDKILGTDATGKVLWKDPEASTETDITLINGADEVGKAITGLAASGTKNHTLTAIKNNVVTDTRINGSSIVTYGVADIPIATNTNLGVVQSSTVYDSTKHTLEVVVNPIDGKMYTEKGGLVTDVKVDGTSVVVDGVANIDLPSVDGFLVAEGTTISKNTQIIVHGLKETDGAIALDTTKDCSFNIGIADLSVKTSESTLGTFNANADVDTNIVIPTSDTSNLGVVKSSAVYDFAKHTQGIAVNPIDGRMYTEKGGKEYTAGNGLTLTDTEFKVTPGTAGQYMITNADGTVGWAAGSEAPVKNTLTMQSGSTTIGTFTANGDNATIDIPTATSSVYGVVKVDSAVSTTSTNPVESRAIPAYVTAEIESLDSSADIVDLTSTTTKDTFAVYDVREINGKIERGTASTSIEIGKADLSIKTPENTLGTFNANAFDATSITIPIASGTALGLVKSSNTYDPARHTQEVVVNPVSGKMYTEASGGSEYTAGNGLTLIGTEFRITPGTSGQYMVTNADGTVGWITGGAAPVENTLTLQSGGATIGTFTANSGDATINIPVATSSVYGVVKIDSTISTTSTNPVESKAIPIYITTEIEKLDSSADVADITSTTTKDTFTVYDMSETDGKIGRGTTSTSIEVGKADLSIKTEEGTLGTFNANASDAVNITIPIANNTTLGLVKSSNIYDSTKHTQEVVINPANGKMYTEKGGKEYTAGNGLTLTDTEFKITPGTSGLYMVTNADGTVGWVTGGAAPVENTLTLQSAGTTIGTFTANGGDATINIPIATSTKYGVVEVDSTISTTSTNPVESKAIPVYITTEIEKLDATVDIADLASTTTKDTLTIYDISETDGKIEKNATSTSVDIGKADLSIKTDESTLGTFNANASTAVNVVIPTATNSVLGLVKASNTYDATKHTQDVVINPANGKMYTEAGGSEYVEGPGIDITDDTISAKISSVSGNGLEFKSDGLYANALEVEAGTSIEVIDVSATKKKIDVKVSTESGNSVEVKSDGLYVGALEVQAGEGIVLSDVSLTKKKVDVNVDGTTIKVNSSNKLEVVDPVVKNILTMQSNGTSIGTFTANGDNATINIPVATSSTYGVVEVDSAISTTSANPVENKAIPTYVATEIEKLDSSVDVADVSSATGKDTLTIYDINEVDGKIGRGTTSTSVDIGKADLSISTAESTLGTFNANASSDVNVVIPIASTTVLGLVKSSNTYDSTKHTQEVVVNSANGKLYTEAGGSEYTAGNGLTLTGTEFKITPGAAGRYLAMDDTGTSVTWKELSADPAVKNVLTLTNADGSEVFGTFTANGSDTTIKIKGGTPNDGTLTISTSTGTTLGTFTADQSSDTSVIIGDADIVVGDKDGVVINVGDTPTTNASEDKTVKIQTMSYSKYGIGKVSESISDGAYDSDTHVNITAIDSNGRIYATSNNYLARLSVSSTTVNSDDSITCASSLASSKPSGKTIATALSENMDVRVEVPQVSVSGTATGYRDLDMDYEYGYYDASSSLCYKDPDHTTTIVGNKMRLVKDVPTDSFYLFNGSTWSYYGITNEHTSQFVHTINTMDACMLHCSRNTNIFVGHTQCSIGDCKYNTPNGEWITEDNYAPWEYYVEYNSSSGALTYTPVRPLLDDEIFEILSIFNID